MHRQKKRGNTQDSLSSALTQIQKSKCLQKFESYKALGSSMLSRNELKRVLVQLGKQISEEQLLQMIYQADQNGHGFISYQSFENMVRECKQQKEENIYEPIGLTFDQILQSYNRINLNKKVTMPWNFIQAYFEDNFGLKISLKNFKTLYNKTELSRQDFKIIFS